MKTLLALLLAGLVLAAEAQTPAQQASMLLDRLGLEAACEQAPALTDQLLGLHAGAFDADPSALSMARERLLAANAPDALCRPLREHLAEHYDANAFAAALAELDTPLAARIRALDRGEGVDLNALDAYRDRLAARAPRASRRELMAELVALSRLARVAARMQTELEQTVGSALALAAGRQPPASDPDLHRQRLQRREALLTERATDLKLFSYRFLPDAQLSQYRDALASESVQWVLELALDGLEQALESGRRETLTGAPTPQGTSE